MVESSLHLPFVTLKATFSGTKDGRGGREGGEGREGMNMESKTFEQTGK